MQEQGLYGTVTEIEHAGAQLERPNGGAVAKLERPNGGLTRRAVGRLAQGHVDHARDHAWKLRGRLAQGRVELFPLLKRSHTAPQEGHSRKSLGQDFSRVFLASSRSVNPSMNAREYDASNRIEN